jgi:DNA-binding GntR family transcriptional regulator
VTEDAVVDIAPPSLVETVTSRLRDDILSGELAPGDRIVEEQLTRRFGISRAPLREALRLLGQQGLVEHLPRRGVRVATLSETEVGELFELRDVLERHAITVALRGLDLDLTDMDAALDMLAGAVDSGDSLVAAAAHRRFHLALVELAGQRHLRSAYEPVLAKLQLYMATNLQREANQRSPMEGLVRHRRLRDTLATRDLEVALRELGDHGARNFLGDEPEAH